MRSKGFGIESCQGLGALDPLLRPKNMLLKTHSGRLERWTRAMLVIGSVFCLSGCIPLRFTTSPGASGRIVDASTRAPIDGAEVVVSRSTYPPESAEKAFDDARSPKVFSHEAGIFSVPLERRVDLYCVPVDVFPRFGMLVIKSPGYVTTCVPFWSHSVAELGEIPVQSAKQ